MPCSRWSASAAMASEGMLPSCQFISMRYLAPCFAVEAQVSITTFMKVSGVSVIVPSNGMCMGVTPSGQAGSTRPSMNSATRPAMTLAASASVPVGKCGPCCSTLPAGRMTSGCFSSWAAISGCVNSEKNRLGSIAASFRKAGPRGIDDVGEADGVAILLDRAQGRVHHRERDIAVVGAELVALAAAAALREQVELGAEHVALRNFQLFPLGVAVLAALDIKRRVSVQLLRRVPGAEIDLVVHQPLGAEDAHGKYSGRRPARPHIADLAIGELDERHRLVVDLGADRRELRCHRARFDNFAAEIMQHVELMDRELRQRAAGCAMLVPAPGLRGELERALVGKIGLDEGDPTELARIDRAADLPDSRHQPCAM